MAPTKRKPASAVPTKASTTAAPRHASARTSTTFSSSSSAARTSTTIDDDDDDIERRLWTPSFQTAVSLLLVVRMASALVNPIADCDETYNYWEPLHFLLHGFGFQTWEYSPVYALRSYVYLGLHWLVAKATALALMLGTIGTAEPLVSKVMVFYGVRAALGLACAHAEGAFYRGVIARFGRRTARYVLWLLVWNAGLFHASTALLPSTFAMYLVMLVTTAWMAQQHFAAVGWGVVAVLCGWPYVGALFVPLMVDTMRARGVGRSIVVGAAVGAAVVALEVAVNRHFYGRAVLPAWQIVAYNVLSSETDSTLYGTEPWTFYARNLALNSNVAAVLAVPAALLVTNLPRSAEPASACLRLAYLSPLYIWLAVMGAQPHKEERFLFPVYPLLCLAAAVTLSVVVHTARRVGSRRLRAVASLAVGATLTLYALLSASRVASNVVNYSAPLRVYQHLYTNVLPSAAFSQSGSAATTTTLCVGKEWHRFPTSFFVPTNATRVAFVQSGFTGQLPQPFAQTTHATAAVPLHMNDRNAEEPSRYVSESACDLFVDLELPHQREHKLSDLRDTWTRVHREPFLLAEASLLPYRAFYIPWLSAQHVRFADYVVYKRIKQ